MAGAARILAGKPFFGGDKMMWGDVAFLTICDTLLCLVPSGLDAYPEIKAWYERCTAVPEVASYMAARAKLGMPGSTINPN